MSNVVRISSHPRFHSGVFPVTHTVADMAMSHERLLGHADVLEQLKLKAGELTDEAFRERTLGAESVAKLKMEQAKMLLSLVASLPTRLRVM